MSYFGQIMYVSDLLVCTFFGSEPATGITDPC